MRSAAFLLVLVVAAGCGSDHPSTATSTLAPLRPAADVTSDDLAGVAHILGDSAKVRDLTITIKTISAANNDGPFMLVEAHIENATATAVHAPQFEMVCHGSIETGGTLQGTTIPDEIPADSFADGTVNVLLPGDGRFGEPIKPCELPAFITIKANVGGLISDADVGVWTVPAALIAQMNTDATAFNGSLPSTGS